MLVVPCWVGWLNGIIPCTVLYFTITAAVIILTCLLAANQPALPKNRPCAHCSTRD